MYDWYLHRCVSVSGWPSTCAQRSWSMSPGWSEKSPGKIPEPWWTGRNKMSRWLLISWTKIHFKISHRKITAFSLHYPEKNEGTCHTVGLCYSVPRSASSGGLWSGKARWGRWLARAQRPQAQRRHRFWTALHRDTVWWHWQTSHVCETLARHLAAQRAAAAGKQSWSATRGIYTGEELNEHQRMPFSVNIKRNMLGRNWRAYQ